jgi:titin
VQYREAKVGAPWFTFPHTPSTATSIVVNGLTNGTAYFFRVAAVNPAGNGATALTTPITPMTIPGAPAGLVATPGNANVVLTWRAPQSDGGGAITNYIVEYKTTSPTAAWVRFPRVASNATTATVTPLVNGTFYTFRVTAVNPAGIGPASVATDVVMPVTVPAVPLNVVAVAGDKLARLTWEKPVTDGGLPITDYVVEYRSTADVAWTTFADGTSTATAATVTGLTNGVTYVFRITARSSFGTGSPSAVSSPVVVMGLPGAPTGLVATAGVNADVQLRWTAPADTGGVALTDFVIEYRRTTDTAWTTHPDGVSTATTVVVSGLATGSSYVFRVSARNPLGAGVASAISNAAAVIAPPSAPTLLVAKAGDKQASLSWTAPAANGSAITDYVIEYRRSTDTGWTVFTDGVTAATSAVVTNLVNGTTYAFRITAKNAAGSSLPTEESNLVRPIGPAAGPTGLTGTPSRGTVTLRWNAPTDTGGEPITRYVIQYRVNRAGTAWVTARWPAGVSPTATTARISGFVTRFGHLFRVAAVTSLGQGAWSAEAGPINPFGAA